MTAAELLRLVAPFRERYAAWLLRRAEQRRLAELLHRNGAFSCGCRACRAWRGAFR